MLASSAEALESLGKSLGLGKLEFGYDMICTLAVGDGLDIEIEALRDSDTMRFNAALMHVGDADESITHLLLTANFNGYATGLAALAINPASDEITLTQAIKPALYTATTFAAEFDQFLRYAMFWQNHIKTLDPVPPSSIDNAARSAESDTTVTIRL